MFAILHLIKNIYSAGILYQQSQVEKRMMERLQKERRKFCIENDFQYDPVSNKYYYEFNGEMMIYEGEVPK